MPRKRSFDTQEVLQKIMFLFWEKGYASTTLRDIDIVSGIKRTSLYNAFESKDELFKEVLRKYKVMIDNNLRNALAEQNIDSFKNIFGNFLKEDWDENAPQHYGCMMVNANMGSRTLDETIVDILKEYEVMWKYHFLKTLQSAHSKGQIRSNLILEECADFLIAALFGILVRVRLARSLTIGKTAAKVVFTILDSWKI